MFKIVELDSVDSTNSYALKHINDLEHLDIILARTQTAGKGRNNNHWVSPEGNLCASIIFKEEINQFHIPFLISLAIKNAIDTLNIVKENSANNKDIEVCLKWPNDIYFFDQDFKVYKKLAGILSEKQNNNIVIGIGLNIKNSPKLAKYPTISLKDLIINTKPKDLIKLILEDFVKYLTVYKEKGFKEIKKTWLESCCHYNKPVQIDKDTGIFRGVDENGFALLESYSGITRSNIEEKKTKTIMAGSLTIS